MKNSLLGQFSCFVAVMGSCCLVAGCGQQEPPVARTPASVAPGQVVERVEQKTDLSPAAKAAALEEAKKFNAKNAARSSQTP